LETQAGEIVSEIVRNQADAARRFAQARRKEFINLATEEQGVVDVINWGELPATRKVRDAFLDMDAKFLRRLKRNAVGEKQWSEAEGRALAIALEYTGLLEDMLGQAKKRLLLIQQKKQKQGEQ
jgi:hypothetical protein